jgi:hypothetical protein
MGKRSNFERKDRDYYPTPIEAVAPLLQHLPNQVLFCEPCAGQGHLIRHLEQEGHKCANAFDLDSDVFFRKQDARFMVASDLAGADAIITNPPWSRDVLHVMIDKFSSLAPTWLLFDSDWAHTKQSSYYMKHCHKIVSIGRVKWIEGSKSVGKDNCAWYMFDCNKPNTGTYFYGR